MNFGTELLHYRRIHNRLYSEVLTKELPKPRKTLCKRLLPFRMSDLNPGWNVPFVGPDKPTVERSQYYHYDKNNEEPVQFEVYFNVGRCLNVLGLVSLAAFVQPLWFCRAGRSFVERNLERITLGYFSTKGPTREQVDTTRFTATLVGKGWSKDINDSNENPNGEPSRPFDKEMTVVVSGKDPVYQATSTCAIQAALTIVKDRALMPK